MGLDHLIFLNDLKSTKLDALNKDTKTFFEKLAGYDTLRLILCKKAILVEGDSDELVVQKAYMINNQGRLPIEDGIDIISVGTSFLRFLEIAKKINKEVSVVTDNDGNVEALKEKYVDYLDSNRKSNITICFDGAVDTGDIEDFNYNTLEPKLLKENDRTILNRILGKSYNSDNELHKYMSKNKTNCALSIFDTSEEIKFPQYILDSIKQNDE